MAAEMVQFYCQNASCGNFDLYLHYCNILLYLNCRVVADPGEGAGGLEGEIFHEFFICLEFHT